MRYLMMFLFLFVVKVYTQEVYSSDQNYDYEYYYYDEEMVDTESIPVPVAVTNEIVSNTGVTKASNISDLPEVTGIPQPPAIIPLPDLNIVIPLQTNLSIPLNPSQKVSYEGTNTLKVMAEAVAVWNRVYTIDSTFFNLPAIGNETLNIMNDNQAVWVQDTKSSNVLSSQSTRKLNISYYKIFGLDFFVFHYPEQNPLDQKIRSRQGFFVRILGNKGHMQMSKNPKFKVQESSFWRRLPTQTINQTSTNPQ